MAEDRITIQDLQVRCIIGVNPEERRTPQPVIIHMTLYTDTRRAAETDDIGHTINYSALADRVVEHVQNSSYFLIETLAHAIARIAVQEFGAPRAQVTVQKPQALSYTPQVKVTVVRTAADFA